MINMWKTGYSVVEAILFASDASFWYWNAKHAYNLKGSYVPTSKWVEPSMNTHEGKG